MPAAFEKKPEAYGRLREEIVARNADLSKRLKAVASYALRFPDDFALEGSKVLAERAGVPVTSVIRFAKAFGFSGFGEMQKVFRSQVRQRTLNLSPDLPTPSSDENPEAVIRRAVTDMTRASINALARMNTLDNAAKLHSAATLILGAKKVHLLALRRSFSISAYLHYCLSQAGVPVNLLSGIGGFLFEQARFVRPGDVVIAISFHAYAPDVIQLVHQMRGQRIPVISFTDGPTSPLVALSDIVFEIEDTEFRGFQPLTTAASLALALTISLVQLRDKDKRRHVDDLRTRRGRAK